MRIALIGYGKMGKEIDRIANEHGASVVLRVDVDSPPLSKLDFSSVDVVIHFAVPSSVVQHVEEISAIGKNLVVGTTGWQNDLEKIRSIVERGRIGLLYASNFSLGVNAFFHLIRHAGAVFNRFAEYDVFVHEAHHREKLDAPSGTALTVAKVLLSEIERKKELLTETPSGRIRPEQLQVSSLRGGTIVGTHSVVFDSPSDTLEITHNAKNRSGFARGALLAAEWIRGKQGIYTMNDLFADILQ